MSSDSKQRLLSLPPDGCGCESLVAEAAEGSCINSAEECKDSKQALEIIRRIHCDFEDLSIYFPIYALI